MEGLFPRPAAAALPLGELDRIRRPDRAGRARVRILATQVGTGCIRDASRGSIGYDRENGAEDRDDGESLDLTSFGPTQLDPFRGGQEPTQGGHETLDVLLVVVRPDRDAE